MSNKKKTITAMSEDFPQWYQDVVREAGLAEVSEVRGCGIVKPYGYRIWELVKEELNRRIMATGAENVYFPIFVPIANLELEADHVEGFAPELAVVTHAGGEELVDKLAIRPTSEAAMYRTYAKWIRSYRDLPMRLNQWANVVRWEKRPRPFLRWSEFQWQEGHTAFASEKEARAEMWQMAEVYEDMYKWLALPTITGQKSQMEKFAGAMDTITNEIMARDGKAIQASTSHYLGTNFAKVFDIYFLGEDGERHPAHQNSWGFSWRSVGAIIMAHGDDNGLRLPPNIAPVQVVVVPIFKEENKDAVLAYAREIEKELAGVRVKVDNRENMSPGFKFNEWEVKGVPIRLEVGGREAENREVTLVRRDKSGKNLESFEGLNKKVTELFVDIQENLYKEAETFRNGHIHRIESMDEIDDQVGFFEASWSETVESEKILKGKYQMVSRVLPRANVDKAPKNKKCFITGEEAKHDWLFAKSY